VGFNGEGINIDAISIRQLGTQKPSNWESNQRFNIFSRQLCGP
jgi:hypothetical protein